MTDILIEVDFTEGIYIDYRSFIQRNITPRYEFGFGLTYSKFSYSEIQAFLLENSIPLQPPGREIAEGGVPSLWETVASVIFVISNTGKMSASEVPQLYIGIPGGPEKVLRGFSKLNLFSGQRVEVIFNLTRRDLSTWDAVRQKWLLPSGVYDVHVGASVLDIRLVTQLVIRNVVPC